MNTVIDIFLHSKDHLADLFSTYGNWTYAFLFIIIFCETGLVVTPFLPGDSLLFAAGALSSSGIGPLWSSILLSIAAILGDFVNYHLGLYIGPKIFERPDSVFFKREYIERTHNFYEKYGNKTIVLARFVPIVRTFAPFLAGMGYMTYRRFAIYNIAGGVFWVFTCIYAGYFFGELPFVKKNFSLVVLVIVAISFLPLIVEFYKARRRPTIE